MTTIENQLKRMSVRNKYVIILVILIGVGSLYLFMSQSMQKEIRIRNGNVSTVLSFHNQLSEIETTLYKVSLEKESNHVFVALLNNQMQQLDHYYASKYASMFYLLDKQNPELGSKISEKYALLKTEILALKGSGYPYEEVKVRIGLVESMMQVNNDFKMVAVDYVKQQSSFIRTMNYAFISVTVGLFLFLFFVMDREVISPLNAMSRRIKSEVDQYHLDALIFDVDRSDEVGVLKQHFNHLTRNISLLNQLALHLNRQETFDEVLDFIFENFKGYIPYDRIGVAKVDRENGIISTLDAKSSKGLVLDSNYGEAISKGSLWKVIESKEPRIINDFEEYIALRPQSKSTQMLMDEGMQSSVTLPLVIENECVGIVFFTSTQKNVYKQEHAEFLKTITGSLVVAFERATLRTDIIVAVINGFAEIVESKDRVTGNHIDRIKIYTRFIAEKLYEDGVYPEDVNPRFIKRVATNSTLHDIGKVGVSDEVLNKNGKLTDYEFEQIKRHSVYGAQILRNMSNQIRNGEVDFFSTAYEITRHHHEKFDGSGYPDKLKGDEIPLSARIVAVADVFDALTSDRPYKSAYNFDQSMIIVLEGSGKHFDPQIIGSLERHRHEFKDIYQQIKHMEVLESQKTLEQSAII